MIYYVCHSGTVNGDFIDEGTLASLYGLSPGEYTTGINEATDKGQHVHLYPRVDGKYKNIKTEVGDVPDGTLFYSISAQAMRRKRRRGME